MISPDDFNNFAWGMIMILGSLFIGLIAWAWITVPKQPPPPEPLYMPTQPKPSSPVVRAAFARAAAKQFVKKEGDVWPFPSKRTVEEAPEEAMRMAIPMFPEPTSCCDYKSDAASFNKDQS